MAIHEVVPKVGGPASSGAKSGRAKPLSLHDYVVAIGISFGLTLFGAVYLGVFRRTYLFGAPPHIDAFYVPNKVIIGTGILMLAFTFLISPLARYFNAFDNLVRYRKEIGIVGGFFALFHVVVSYFYLPLKFPRSGMDFTGVIYGAGLVATFVIIFLILISFQKAVDLLGSQWWFLHRWGLRVLILFAVIHVYVMKWNGAWVKWVMKGGGPSTPELPNGWLPGLGLLTGISSPGSSSSASTKRFSFLKDLGLKPKEISRDENLRRHGRRFVIGSFCVLIAGYVFILTRWM